MNTFTSAELERSFILNLPDGLTEAAPLVFAYHGLGGSSTGMLEYSGLDALDHGEPVIFVVPNSARTAEGEREFPIEWNILAPQFDNDNQDLVFFDDIVTCVSEQFPVDDNRIYVTGMSAGGLWTTFVTMHREHVIAASAPMSGGYMQAWPDPTPTPILISWGGASDVAVGTNFHDLANELIANVDASDFAYATCNHNQAHTWPAEMSAAVWSWLSGHTLGEASPFVDALPPEFPGYCTLP